MAEVYARECERLGIRPRAAISSFLALPRQHLDLYGASHDLYTCRLTDTDVEALVNALLRTPPEGADGDGGEGQGARVDLPPLPLVPGLVLDLGCNPLTDACLPHLARLASCPGALWGLSLRATAISGEGAAGCMATEQFLLSPHCALRYLSLAGTALGARGTEAVACALLNSEPMHFGLLRDAAGRKEAQPYGTLQYLDLSDTGFGEAANLCLCDLLRSRFCGLRELRLNAPEFNTVANYHEAGAGLSGVRRLAAALRYNTSLEALSLRSCQALDDQAVSSLLAALKAQVPGEDGRQTRVSAKAGQARLKSQQRASRAVQKYYGHPDAAVAEEERRLPPALPLVSDYERRQESRAEASRQGSSSRGVPGQSQVRTSSPGAEPRGSRGPSRGSDLGESMPGPGSRDYARDDGAAAYPLSSQPADALDAPGDDEHKRMAVTPLRYLDLGANHLSFETAISLARYLRETPESVLSTIVLDGARIQNRGANELARALLQYSPNAREVQALEERYQDASSLSAVAPAYEAWGAAGLSGSICLSLRRTAIGGQGLSTLALLCKHNRAIRYLAVEGCTLEPEQGESGTVNERRRWNPREEWEVCFKVRGELMDPCTTDFGLKRNEDGVIQYYREEALQLRGMSVFR